MSVNKAILIGNLGKDPELRQLNGDKQVCFFSLATTYGYGDNKSTEWHNVECWNKTAETASKYLKKGSKVYLEGRIKYESYQSNGETKHITKIVVNDLKMLDSKKTQIPSHILPEHPNLAENKNTEQESDKLPF